MGNELKTIKKIKSVHILERIFSFLWQNKKLDIIAHNKKLQRTIGLDLEDYIKTSNKNKIVTIKGMGRECLINSDKIIFEGEYLHGKKMEKEKNIIIMVISNLKENIKKDIKLMEHHMI